jgi:hypothetical protein
MNSKISVGKREPFVKNLLFVEGISRSGKFLMANILSGIESVEPVQYNTLLEQLPIWKKFGLVDFELSKEILQCEIDLDAYELFIGRNLNHRKSDKSSIYNQPSFDKYLERCDKEDGQKAKERYFEQKLYNMFILHDMMSHIDIYLDMFPNVKIIHIERNPISLTYSWWKRGLGARPGKDPIFFKIMYKTETDMNVPWYAIEWQEEYNNLSDIDKIIKSIDFLQGKEREAEEKISRNSANNLLTIKYEDVLCDTDAVIKKICTFLNRSVNSDIKKILTQENLPNKDYFFERDRRLNEIKKEASNSFVDKLILMESRYLNNV